MLLTIITFLIVLSVIVFFHELGHFATARKFGVKAEEFGLGFPPRAFGIYHNQDGKWKKVWGGKKVEAKGTIYSLNWIPLGGFVKIKGENVTQADIEKKDKDSFAFRPIWQRFIILIAGVCMNVVLAIVLLSVGFMIGLPQELNSGLGAGARVSDHKIQVTQVMPDSPAAKADLRLGDAILNVDNRNINTSEDLQKITNDNVNKKMTYQIKRGQEELSKEITPIVLSETKKGGIGIGIAETGIVSYPWYAAIREGSYLALYLLWVILAAFGALIKGLFMGQGAGANLAGPVGIAVLTGQMARLGLVYVMQFTAMLSLNLAIINALPFPALDGGRILFLLIEKIKGSPVKKEIEGVIHNIGFALLMCLILVVTFKDVASIGGKLMMLWAKIW
jgi:regulator of sigma E protease